MEIETFQIEVKKFIAYSFEDSSVNKEFKTKEEAIEYAKGKIYEIQPEHLGGAKEDRITIYVANICSDEDIFEISKIYTYGEEEIEER